MVSLKNIRDRLVAAEKYLKTTDANNFIAGSGTCSQTANLSGRPVSSYTCGGSCSWTCSGGCSKGAGNL